uniref:Uncharacterized protein n=1 Tax=Megaselia scalaris TaxID=36166 RepID=T1H353_MEGSC
SATAAANLTTSATTQRSKFYRQRTNLFPGQNKERSRTKRQAYGNFRSRYRGAGTTTTTTTTTTTQKPSHRIRVLELENIPLAHLEEGVYPTIVVELVALIAVAVLTTLDRAAQEHQGKEDLQQEDQLKEVVPRVATRMSKKETKKETIEEKKNEDGIKEVVIELPVTEQSSSEEEEKQVTETVEIKE